MGFKDDLDRETNALLSVKRPYETAAFLVFAVLFIQQMGIFLVKLLDFIEDSAGAATGWFSTGGLTTPFFVSRIIQLDNKAYRHMTGFMFSLASRRT